MNKEIQQQLVNIAVEAFNGGLKQGAEIERERIIELLETDCKNGSIEFAVALIKGENNA